MTIAGDSLPWSRICKPSTFYDCTAMRCQTSDWYRRCIATVLNTDRPQVSDGLSINPWDFLQRHNNPEKTDAVCVEIRDQNILFCQKLYNVGPKYYQHSTLTETFPFRRCFCILERDYANRTELKFRVIRLFSRHVNVIHSSRHTSLLVEYWILPQSTDILQLSFNHLTSGCCACCTGSHINPGLI